MNNLELRVEEMSVSTEERQIRAEMFPRFIFDVSPDRTYTRDVFTYHIPFAGDEVIFHCTPNPFTSWTTSVSIEDDRLCFEIINFYNDADRIKQSANEIVSGIQHQLNYVVAQVASYNSQLPQTALEMFQARKKHLLQKHELLASLGVPIRKREDFPQTFAIPTPANRRKLLIAPPQVTSKGFKPDPTLDMTVYQEILQTIHDVGKQFERMPSTYSNKGEEDLRDHILLVLEPRFEGFATGETFNKTGKTDILIRHEGSNVFIAECKFWRGAKAYLETLSQLMGYLTWRDSKAAAIIFVQNKDFTATVRTAEEETPKHPNFLGFVDKRDETWFNYRFHINDDPNREIKLAVLLFHIPSK